MFTPHKPIVVILLGPPGAGKGTHAGPLSEQLNLPHISTGDLFRDNIRLETPLGLKAKEFIDIGKLVPDELVLDMLFDRISLPDCERGYILDGFPRTLPQATALDLRLQNTNQIIALNFTLPDPLIVERISGRLMCKECGRPHHKLFDPPTSPNLCNHCKGALYQRDDDKEAVIMKRLEVYHRQTRPVIDFFAAKKETLRQIDSKKSKPEVLSDVLEALSVAAFAL